MPYIGNVQVPLIESQDLSKERELVEREYVDFNPTVTEHEHRLEGGNYSFLLLSPEDSSTFPLTFDAQFGSSELEIHYSMEEQRRGVEALTDRNAAQNPANVHGDTGFLSVESVSFVREPRRDSHYGGMDIQFMEDEEYQPGILVNRETAVNDFNMAESALVAIPDVMTNVEERNPMTGVTSGISPRFTLTTERGNTMEVFRTTEEQILYEFPSTNFVDAERVGEVRAFRNDTRLFGDPHEVDSGVKLTNRCFEWNAFNGNCRMYVGGDGWHDMGNFNLGLNNPFIQEMDTPFAKVTDDFGEEVYLKRGASFLAMEIAAQDFVELDTSNATWPVQSTETIWDGSTYVGRTGNDTYDFFIAKSRNLGSFAGTQTMRYENIPTERDVRVVLGAIFDTGSAWRDDYEAWWFSDPNIVRTLFARGKLGYGGSAYGEDYGDTQT